MRYKTDELQRGQPDRLVQNVAWALGGFSIVLGLLELVFGGSLARALGMQDYEWLVRLYGARELLTGILIFFFRDPTVWIWFRVLGDALDVSTWLSCYNPSVVPASRFLFILVTLAFVTALDLFCSLRLSRDSRQPLSPPRNYSRRSGFPENGITVRNLP